MYVLALESSAHLGPNDSLTQTISSVSCLKPNSIHTYIVQPKKKLLQLGIESIEGEERREGGGGEGMKLQSTETSKLQELVRWSHIFELFKGQKILEETEMRSYGHTNKKSLN